MLSLIKRYLRKINFSRKEEEILSGLTSKVRELIVRIRSQNLTYLSDQKLASLASTCLSVEVFVQFMFGFVAEFFDYGCRILCLWGQSPQVQPQSRHWR
jgi:hypothetical protein